MDNTIERLVEWLQNQVISAGSKGIIFGLSGGVDSAVMAGLAKKAFPDNSVGVIMPCHSIDQDEEHGILVAKSLGLETLKVDLSSTYDELLNAVNIDCNNKLARSNIKPRLRMTTLYYFAQTFNYLVAGPTNKSEFITGYFTKHGDSAVDMLPLIDFTKSEIYEMAEILKIPKEIIEKTPSAGLWKNQSDEEEMGFTYEVLESYINKEEVSNDLSNKIDNMYKKSQHKRQYPPYFKK